MNTVYSCPVERRDFGDLLSPENVSRLDLQTTRDLDFLSLRPSHDHSLLAVWSQDPGKEPNFPTCSYKRTGQGATGPLGSQRSAREFTLFVPSRD